MGRVTLGHTLGRRGVNSLAGPLAGLLVNGILGQGTEVQSMRRATTSGRGKHFATWLFRLLNFVLDRRGYVVVVLKMFQEIADVQEGVAIEANIHKGRLHTGEDSCDAAFVETSD
jgi:hypothetical protein